MKRHSSTTEYLSSTHQFGIYAVSIIVALYGIYILVSTLVTQIIIHHADRISNVSVDVPLLIGLSLIYLSLHLRRRKRTAWFVTVLAYAFYVGANLENILDMYGTHRLHWQILMRIVILPLLILILLLAVQKEYIVRSDIQGFRAAVKFSLAILLIAFFYGVGGFMLLDKSDFHQEISASNAVVRTVDQFDLTSARPLHPYTKRARVFIDSLSVVSIGAIAYALISLFQPLRARFSDQSTNRLRLHSLLKEYEASSEDYFKLWPHDKLYLFDDYHEAGLALRVHHGVALCLGDPAGKPAAINRILKEFDETCFNNDWLPAHIHVDARYKDNYLANGYNVQKIGQEAVVDINRFLRDVSTNKYFRNIASKFEKQSYHSELLSPPHHQAVIDRLRVISNEWLAHPGRVERGFAMGYFSDDYMQQCDIMVVRDAADTIQAFLNMIPSDFDSHEATYDLLRQSDRALGNINDFLLMKFMEYVGQHGYQTVNLGLCPLAGLTEHEEGSDSFVSNLLRFAYTNGERIYSFSGLYRFKAKYQPEWSDRYVAYKGGLRGFSRTMTALTRTMRVRSRNL